MKLKQYIKIACLSSFAAVATSCLDLEPKANLSDSTVWDKASNFPSNPQLSSSASFLRLNVLSSLN